MTLTADHRTGWSFATPVLSGSQSPFDRFQGLIEFAPLWNSGIQIFGAAHSLRRIPLYAHDGRFANEGLWLIFPSFYRGTWIEVGYTFNGPLAGQGVPPGDHFYFAYSNKAGQYRQFFPAAITDSMYSFRTYWIEKASSESFGNCKYRLVINDIKVATVEYFSEYAANIQAGIESTSNETSSVIGNQTGMTMGTKYLSHDYAWGWSWVDTSSRTFRISPQNVGGYQSWAPTDTETRHSRISTLEAQVFDRSSTGLLLALTLSGSVGFAPNARARELEGQLPTSFESIPSPSLGSFIRPRFDLSRILRADSSIDFSDPSPGADIGTETAESLMLSAAKKRGHVIGPLIVSKLSRNEAASIQDLSCEIAFIPDDTKLYLGEATGEFGIPWRGKVTFYKKIRLLTRASDGYLYGVLLDP